MLVNKYYMYTLLERAKNRVGHDGYIELNAIFNAKYREKRSKEIFSSVFFLGVKKHQYLDRNLWNQVEAKERFEQMDKELDLLRGMTPRQLLRIFPIDKTYDKTGDVKDYRTTVKMLDTYGMDTRIDSVVDFLWDYSNWDLRIYLVDYLTALDDLEKENGKSGMIEQFLTNEGMTHD
ncbi:hypothetical protein C5Z25_12045 [Lactobacillus sp. CBA3605]|uniref:hypothetical protein n=1 Tax=Lactobacillus sp. CBA3605 TaxID=2099788 RepID=UPI000CFBD2E5|nr:hypothetical protein [Lactobacillus sp. CBA3605]AVK62444.1 hypothetical protein C5Z25_12045 [Lactobacillus sp. CBA3605]